MYFEGLKSIQANIQCKASKRSQNPSAVQKLSSRHLLAFWWNIFQTAVSYGMQKMWHESREPQLYEGSLIAQFGHQMTE